ncbi:MAG TPA: tetratricopeptide repeat protein, partial [Vicinamibacterales bacterium]|nr:tetratricopeptide repeat protein [Vicinamibacterales bacterium]
MKVPVLVLCALVGLTALPAEADQNNPRGSSNSSSSAQAADPVAEAYAQFLMAHRLEDDEDIDGAIAAYKRAMTLDPGAASIVADLANLYMRLNRVTDAINTAEQALKIDAKNRAAHQVLGSIYASQAMSGGRNQRTVQQESLPKAIDHLEQAIANTEVPADANTRALLSRLYIAANNYDKAIPMLAELVKQEPGWQDGAMLLMQAYTAAGRTDEALKWLEESAPENPDLYETLADYYSRQRRFADAAEAYGKAVDADPRNPDLRLRYAGSLINAGTPDTIAKARDVLTESLALRGNDERTMYLLSQAQRQLGDFAEAERTARQLISAFRTSPRGYLALAETLEERQGYSDVVDALAPAVTQFRSVQNGSTALSMLLPHLGFAYQQLGQSDKAIDTFSEALKLSPDDEVLTSYLLQAQLSAKKYTEALALVRAARQQDPDDLRLATIEAQALRQTGKTDEGIAILEGLVAKRGDDPQVYIALAQVYSDASRPAQA